MLSTTIVDNPPSQRDPVYLGHLLYELTMHMEDFYALLIKLENDDDDDHDTASKALPSVKHHLLENQLHESFRPLGFERVKITELISEMLHCSKMGLMNSKRGEKIARTRDKCRDTLDQNSLEKAMKNLNINDNTITSNTLEDKCNNNDSNDSNDNQKQKKNIKKKFHDNELYSTFDTSDDNIDDDDDMSFEIPYVSETQNLKYVKTLPLEIYSKLNFMTLGFCQSFYNYS